MTSSFEAEVVIPGRGRCFRVDISLDDFATVACRYSDVAGMLDGTNEYEPRLLSAPGSIHRSFGQQRIATSSRTTLKLANADGGVDWICGRENIADAKRARFRIYVVLYDKTVTAPIFYAKQLGEFVLSSWPAQDNDVVMLELADDFMGKLGAGLLLPTLDDWRQVGNASNNPIYNSIGLPSSINLNTPVQLAFGEDVLLAFPAIIPWNNNASGDPYFEKIIVPLYCTTNLGAVSQDLVQSVTVESYRFDVDQQGTFLFPINRDFYSIDPSDSTTVQQSVWRVEKSPTITKGGRDFQVVYLVVREDLGIQRFQDVNRTVPASTAEGEAARQAQLSWLRTFAYANGYPAEAVDSTRQFPYVASRVTKWYVRAYPKSQITNPPSSNFIGFAHSVDVLVDLIQVYSSAVVSPDDFPRVKAGVPFASCSGVVHAWTERANNPSEPPPPMSLRGVLTEIAQSADIDVFAKWSGLISFSSDVYDFTTATQSGSLVEIREEDTDSMMRWTPSDGERGAPFNTVYFTGGKSSPTTYQDVPFQGPFYVSDADIPLSAGLVEIELRQGWRPFRQQALDPIQWRSIDGVCRDRIRFSTNISGLRLELGGYFKLTWTRGPQNAPVYTATVFQCEAIAYSPDGDVVEIEGVWRDDTVSERQYLLDDETLLVRTKNAAGTLSFDPDNLTADIVSGSANFATMGAQSGDILVLRDSTEPDDEFTRNCAMRIDFVVPTQITVVDVFGGGGPYSIANADWYIVRGATTYPTAISDPSNYPSGGSMYGKVTDGVGETSDAQTGNRLVSG